MDWTQVTDFLRNHGKETVIAIAIFIFMIYLVMSFFGSGMISQLINGFGNVNVNGVVDQLK